MYLTLKSTFAFVIFRISNIPLETHHVAATQAQTHLASCSSSSLLLLEAMSQPQNSVIVLQGIYTSILMGFYTLYWFF